VKDTSRQCRDESMHMAELLSCRTTIPKLSHASLLSWNDLLI
jgi:hypothetical protein